MYFFEQDLETQLDIILEVVEPIQKIREKLEDGGIDFAQFRRDPATTTVFQQKLAGFGGVLEILKFGIKEQRVETLTILAKLFGYEVEEMKSKTNVIQLALFAKQISKREDLMELFTR